MQEFRHVGRHNNVTLIAHLHATAGIMEVLSLGQGLLASASPMGTVILTRGRVARRRMGQKKVFASSRTLPHQLHTESACLPRGCVLSTHHTDWDSDTANTRSGFRTDTTVKSLRQREQKRFSLNQDQSIFCLFVFFKM